MGERPYGSVSDATFGGLRISSSSIEYTAAVLRITPTTAPRVALIQRHPPFPTLKSCALDVELTARHAGQTISPAVVLHRWRRELREFGAKAFSGPGRNRADENRIAALERKVG